MIENVSTSVEVITEFQKEEKIVLWKVENCNAVFKSGYKLPECTFSAGSGVTMENGLGFDQGPYYCVLPGRYGEDDGDYKLGSYQLVSKDDLLQKRSDYVKKDCFQIQLMLELQHVDPVEKRKANGKWVQSLHNDLDHLKEKSMMTSFKDLSLLLETGLNSDVILELNDWTTLKAHKGILSARSRVFAAMFNTDMCEKTENIVKIHDISVEPMKLVLKFIYSGLLPDHGTMNTDCNESWRIFKDYPGEIINASEKYGLEDLYEFCRKALIMICTKDNICELLQLAQLYGLESVMISLSEFMKQNSRKLLHK